MSKRTDSKRAGRARPTTIANRRGRAHAALRVTVGIMSAPIDRKLAPLIREMWRAGIRTWTSCENVDDIGSIHPYGFSRAGWALIGFPTLEDAVTFMTLVTRFEPGGKSLYNSITRQGCRGVRAWDYTVNPIDYSYDERRDRYRPEARGVARFGFGMTICFPQSDLPVLVSRLQEQNARAPGRTR
jgi:hypothetical protein